MSSLVLDSSAALAALVRRPVDTELSARLRAADEIHAPHLIDVEVLNGLRRLVMSGELSADRASEAVRDMADLAVIRYPHVRLSERIWSLRENLTAHDACFVAVAEALRMPLVTCDRRMSAAPKLKVRIEVFSTSGEKSRPKRKTKQGRD